MRYKSNDQFWFSLFHEIGHLLEPKRTDYIDVDDALTTGRTEADADRFARDTLISPDAYDRFVASSDFSETAVRRFARGEMVAPGIVVGRLERERHLARGHLSHLKKSLTWLEA
jgi:HTH-type transcriptional regulator/antitoxin HigA